MEIDSEKLMVDAIRDGMRKGVADKLAGYNSPLEKLMTACFETHRIAMSKLLEESIGSCLTDSEFREDIKKATRHNLAKTLIQRFGGEIEKQVNVLKSDPTTRARIVLAIEEIVKSKE